MYKVNPVFALIEPGKSLDIAVTRTGGPIKPEKLHVLTTPFDGDTAEKAYENKEIVPCVAVVQMVGK
ncbi:hypothetical protein DICVIV_08353 [Dictyocaulus viviparus]|uniref:MSP domain-containing protein n=1 Tax=Dictyocaulus viviparus TaxID=29172 RepID=A0A0D8XLQ8_DICVI|nr:hypothetical protein DICVIV_08353 [Dictyocaulus viviparus]